MMQPGTKVARQASTFRPDLLMLGTIQGDGNSVVWKTMINHDGHDAGKFGGGFTGRAVPLSDGIKPCPQQLTHLC